MNEYIDVRGPHPTYVNGMVQVTFDGYARDITVEECKKILKSTQFFSKEYSTYTVHHPLKDFKNV